MRTCETCKYAVKYRSDTFSKSAFYCSLTKHKNSSIGLKRIDSIKKADNSAWYFNGKRSMRYKAKNNDRRLDISN